MGTERGAKAEASAAEPGRGSRSMRGVRGVRPLANGTFTVKTFLTPWNEGPGMKGNCCGYIWKFFGSCSSPERCESRSAAPGQEAPCWFVPWRFRGRESVVAAFLTGKRCGEERCWQQ